MIQVVFTLLSCAAQSNADIPHQPLPGAGAVLVTDIPLPNSLADDAAAAADVTNDVFCGTRRAENCAACGFSSSQCNGDCAWRGDVCASRGVLHPGQECGDQCTGESCAFCGHNGICRLGPERICVAKRQCICSHGSSPEFTHCDDSDPEWCSTCNTDDGFFLRIDDSSVDDGVHDDYSHARCRFCDPEDGYSLLDGKCERPKLRGSKAALTLKQRLRGAVKAAEETDASSTTTTLTAPRFHTDSETGKYDSISLGLFCILVLFVISAFAIVYLQSTNVRFNRYFMNLEKWLDSL